MLLPFAVLWREWWRSETRRHISLLLFSSVVMETSWTCTRGRIIYKNVWRAQFGKFWSFMFVWKSLQYSCLPCSEIPCSVYRKLICRHAELRTQQTARQPRDGKVHHCQATCLFFRTRNQNSDGCQKNGAQLSSSVAEQNNRTYRVYNKIITRAIRTTGIKTNTQ